MRTPNKLALVLVTAALALAPTAAVAATPATATPSAVALWTPPYQPPGHQPCYGDVAPTYVDVLSDHVQKRMAERGVTEQQLEAGIRIGARTAWCQQNGNWRYTLWMSEGKLVVIVGLGDGGWTAVTAWWG